MRKRIVLFLGLAALSLVVSGCGAQARTSDPRTVVAGFYPLAWLAEQLGARPVVDLTPPGAEPHDVELSAGDVRRIRDARLVLYLGSGFQPALERAVATRDGRSLDLLAGRPLLTAPGGGVDPHVWLDPVLFAGTVRRVAAALGRPAAADPVIARLRALDRLYARGLGRCARRRIVTSHAAFGYLARRYGLVQVPLAGLAPDAEPTPRSLARTVGEVRASHATTIFVEPLASRRVAETVARETGAGTAVLDPVESLSTSRLHAGEDYVDVMRDNLATLRTALGCR